MRNCVTLPTLVLNFTILACSMFRSMAQAQDQPEGPRTCKETRISATTDRPTYSNGTETTQCGVLEIMGGPERQWNGHGLHQDDSALALQFGLTASTDLYYSSNIFWKIGSHTGDLSGMSDTYVGVRHRFIPQRHYVPSFATYYILKVPTANSAVGMSTGRYDHSFSLILSRDFPKVHMDLNITPQRIGRSAASGYDQNASVALSASVPIRRTVTFSGTAFGFTALNQSTSAYGVGSVGVNWQVAPRLILDVSMDEGLTSAAPRKRIGFGFTYAPLSLYSTLLHPHRDIH